MNMTDPTYTREDVEKAVTEAQKHAEFQTTVLREIKEIHGVLKEMKKSLEDIHRNKADKESLDRHQEEMIELKTMALGNKTNIEEIDRKLYKAAILFFVVAGTLQVIFNYVNPLELLLN